MEYFKKKPSAHEMKNSLRCPRTAMPNRSLESTLSACLLLTTTSFLALSSRPLLAAQLQR